MVLEVGRLRGVRTPHLKNTADHKPEELPLPSEICVPMLMHMGIPAKPVVKAGDEVKVGQLIGEAGGFLSAPVHSGVSGKVKSVNEVDPFTGQSGMSVTITTDGEQTIYEGVSPPEVTNLKEFLEAVRDSGCVGLGGAGFPTAVKLTVRAGAKIDYIIVNGAECEPYITSDTRTMLDDVELIREALELLQKYLDVQNIIIGIEKNKPKAIASMEGMASEMPGVEVKALPSRYPQGGEKMLIYSTTGRIVPEGGLPLDVGVLVLNCTTLTAIARYIKTGMPLVTKCVTVDGSSVKDPKNVIAIIGTPLRELFDYCGGLDEDNGKILYGGPMMGIALPSLDMPVIKNTNAVLAFARKDSEPPVQTACIRCGRCIEGCPMKLMALEIERAYQIKKPELLERHKVNLCLECGCCAFRCPAARPLIQSIKLSKTMLRDHQAALKAAEDKKKEAKMDE